MTATFLSGRLDFAQTDGIDRKHLALVRRRFLLLNRERLERLRLSARERERLIVDVLPLLFHVNHPSLPGWISAEAPCSISDYTPTQASLAAAKKITRSFSYERKASMKRQLLGLYLMGSTGTVAYSGESDLDLWVLYPEDMDASARLLLDEKIARISAYAREQGCTLHGFPMTVTAFRERRHGELSTEHAGTTQHMLLLDEFYRSAILLGGRPPLWWMIPPEHHHDYDAFAELLTNKRYLRGSDYIDFGNVEKIPAEEFFSGAVWQLYKAIDSPYKSVLKLLLMEAYAQSEPAMAPLSYQLKQRIYDGVATLDDCDPYLMALTSVENYLLSQGSSERLELMRRCFYQKVGEKLSIHVNDSWRRTAVESRVKAWGWTLAHCAMQDNRRSWKVQRVMQERRALANELTHSYRVLSGYARTHVELAQLNQRDLTILGRKLYAALEKRSGKIELINPGIAPDLAEPHLTVALASDEQRYALFVGQLNADEASAQTPLRYAREPIELLAWAHLNGLLTRQTHLHCARLPSCWRLSEMQAIVRAIAQMLTIPLNTADHDELLAPASLRRAAVFLNPGLDPFAERNKQGLHLVSGRTDPLSYGNNRENLLATVVLLRLNSWGEVEVQAFYGADALAEVLRLLYSSLGKESPVPLIDVHCFSISRAEPLIKRVTDIIDTIMGRLRRVALQTPVHYFLPSAGGAWHFHLQQTDCQWQALRQPELLLQFFSDGFAAIDNIHFDETIAAELTFASLYHNARSHVVQLYFRPERDRIEIHIIDEHLALTITQHKLADWELVLRPWYVFLTNIAQRLLALNAVHTLHEPEFLEFLPARMGKPASFRKLHYSLSDHPLRYYSVSASAQLVSGKLQDIVLTCGLKEHTELEWGEQLFVRTVREILQQRQGKARYPVFITDLALSGVQNDVHTALYIRHKLDLENRLNQAMMNL